MFLVSEGRFLYHRLTAEERTLSSHARELLPAVLAARAFGPEWRGRYVAFAFDNSGTAFSVSSGASRDAGARDMLRMVADATVAYDFAMIGLWTQRAANVLNDAGSKVRVEKWSTEPVRIDYAADEMAAHCGRVSTRRGEGLLALPSVSRPDRRPRAGIYPRRSALVLSAHRRGLPTRRARGKRGRPRRQSATSSSGGVKEEARHQVGPSIPLSKGAARRFDIRSDLLELFPRAERVGRDGARGVRAREQRGTTHAAICARSPEQFRTATR